MMTLKEFIAIICTMLAVWVMVPWNTGLTRWQIGLAFWCVAVMAFLLVGMIEMIYEAVREWMAERKGK